MASLPLPAARPATPARTFASFQLLPVALVILVHIGIHLFPPKPGCRREVQNCGIVYDVPALCDYAGWFAPH